jgi:hypothetical protein
MARRSDRRAIWEATRARRVGRAPQSYRLLEEGPSDPRFPRLRVVSAPVRRVVDRVPIYVDRDLAEEAPAYHRRSENTPLGQAASGMTRDLARALAVRARKSRNDLAGTPQGSRNLW